MYSHLYLTCKKGWAEWCIKKMKVNDTKKEINVKRIAMIVLFMGLNTGAMASILPMGSYIGQTVDGITLTTNRPDAASNQEVENFLGISSLGGVEGSAIKGAIYLEKDQVFSFDWDFSTSWSVGSYKSADYVDFSFVNLNFQSTDVFSTLALASDTTKNGKFEWTATQAGLLNFGIGVMDVGSINDDSSLVISNINPVPLPAAAWLFMSALVGFAGFRRKANS